MKRGVALYLVGSTVLLALVGCGRGWMQEREAWRRDAEVACVKSGAVKAGPTITPVQAINGPGMCGADYPFKVAALGEGPALGYNGAPRPPQGIPQLLRNLPQEQRYEPAAEPVRARAGDAPMSIGPSEGEPEEDEEPEVSDVDPYAVPGARPLGRSQPGRAARDSYPQARTPAPYAQDAPLPRLGPQRDLNAPISAATAIAPVATLACPMISALDQWFANAVQPAAQRWFGQPVVEVKQISAYSCRGMNGQRGAPISEHAFGNALDIAAFTLADGRRITVKGGWRGEPEEQGFLRDVQAAACRQFSTVLAPGSNIYHYDHIHVDLRRRRSDNGICKPAAMSGELVAQRARENRHSGRGSGRMGFAAEEKETPDFGIKLPPAIPGAD